VSLKQWREYGWLEPHLTNRAELASWIEQATRSLADSRVKGLSSAGKFRLAYDAALIVATAALGAAGFRPDRRDSHHLRAFASLEFTIGTAATQRELLERFRRKRNRNLYEGGSDISEVEAQELIALATALSSELKTWLKANHPELG
jgi:hypothetical protein